MIRQVVTILDISTNMEMMRRGLEENLKEPNSISINHLLLIGKIVLRMMLKLCKLRVCL